MLVPLVATCAASLALLLVAEVKGWRLLRGVTKLICSATFVALGVASGGSTALIVALVLCALGDALLLARDGPVFAAGILAFLLAHVAFVVVFVLLGLHLGTTALTLVGASAVGAAVVRALWSRVGSLAGMVTAYVAVISVMVATAAGTSVAHAAPLVLVGAALFFVSDLFVARERFMTPTPVNRMIGLPLYFGACLLLAWAIPRVA